MYSGTCLIRHTKRPGKCVGLYRMSGYSDFILVNRNTFGPKLRCRIAQIALYLTLFWQENMHICILSISISATDKES